MVKKAIHIVTLVIYPILMFLIETTCFGILFWKSKGMKAHEIEMCLVIASLFAVHYFIFILTRDKAPDKLYSHLLCCAYLLGVDVLYALFMSIFCFSVPLVIVFHIFIVAVRSMYVASQWRQYKRLQEVVS